MTLSRKLKANWTIVVAWVLSLLLFALGSVGLYETFKHPHDKLVITACRPETYEFPGPGGRRTVTGASDRYEEGPKQEECESPFANDEYRNNQIMSDETIRVVGQVCYWGKESESYTLTVAWVSVKTNNQFEVLRVPARYKLGCNEPYDTTWHIPPEMLFYLQRDAQDGSLDADRWKIIGTATPSDTEKNSVYRWDSTQAFNVVLVD